MHADSCGSIAHSRHARHGGGVQRADGTLVEGGRDAKAGESQKPEPGSHGGDSDGDLPKNWTGELSPALRFMRPMGL